MEHRKVVLYISMSLDGFIATKDDDLSWLSVVEQEGEDYGYFKMAERADAYIVGRATYDVVCNLLDGKFPQGAQYDCYVITRQERESENGVTFYNGPIEDLVRDLRTKPGKDIYCDGGGMIVKLLQEKDLIDEYIVSVIPVLLGDGKRLFIGGTDQLPLTCVSAKKYDSGLVQLHYVRPRD